MGDPNIDKHLGPLLVYAASDPILCTTVGALLLASAEALAQHYARRSGGDVTPEEAVDIFERLAKVIVESSGVEIHDVSAPGGEA